MTDNDLARLARAFQTCRAAQLEAQCGVLAVIVAIRTLLSFALELEVSGRWPWQRNREGTNGKSP